MARVTLQNASLGGRGHGLTMETDEQRAASRDRRPVRRQSKLRVAILAAIGLMAYAHSFAPVARGEIDISGGWQANILCIGNTTIIQTLYFSESVSPGFFPFSLGPACGTLEFEGPVRPLADCSAQPGVQGGVSGSSFSLPPTGGFGFTGILADPYASPSFPMCDSFTRYDVQLRITGTIQTDGADRATRIDGQWDALSYSLYNSDAQFCASGGCPDNCCTLTLLRNDVTPGANQTASPYEGASVTFAAVATGGNVVITPLNEPAALLPANFQILDTPIFFDVTTTAEITAPIAVCLPYPDANHDGFVDGTTPLIDETTLLLLHEEDGVFVDRTSSRDTAANVICAQVDSLSQFIFGAAAAPCGDGHLDPGEDCDLGAGLNGSPTSCCTALCTLRPSDEVCRLAAEECDLQETCTGTSPICPADESASAGTSCADGTSPCIVGTCDGLGICVTAPVADGTSCDDGLSCNGSDLCLDGVCLHTEANCAVVAPHGSYKCYKAKDLKNPPFQKIKKPGISLGDAFMLDPDVTVVKPFHYCEPADVDGGGFGDSPAPLCCYKVRGRKVLPPPTVATSDGFGDLSLLLRKPDLLCQPCSANIAPAQ